MDNVKNIILVSSGKGGVGKSTVAANLVCALHLSNKKVALLDADIHGPSQFKLFGITQVSEDNNVQYPTPIISHGIPVLSVAAYSSQSKMMAWRGNMLSVVLNAMIFNTEWGELDYLIVDMPPGTGDIQIEICQSLPKAKALIVTTPQDVAVIDCIKGIEMFVRNKIEILGVIENMSGYSCENCGHHQDIFGSGGADKIAEEYQVDVLVRIPLTKVISTQSDAGIPVVLHDEISSEAKVYFDIAEKIYEKSIC
jgi:ATP-binding protein involved in chromosome partitioning